MAKTNSKPSAKPVKNSSKLLKGCHYAPPNASKELPLSFYQQDKIKGKKKSEVPDL